MSLKESRHSDSDDCSETDDGIQEIHMNGSTESRTKSAVAPKKIVYLTPIATEIYQKNEAAIKSALRPQTAKIYTKFPLGSPIDATRFATPHTILLYTIPEHTGSVQLGYSEEDFPGGYVSFYDHVGARWKCVAVWTGDALIYISNMQAEIGLCGKLYAGSPNGGKVRWDKAVTPLNMAPDYEIFAVSDRVLSDRRKKQWPAQLLEMQQQCRNFPISFASSGDAVRKNLSEPSEMCSFDAQKQLPLSKTSLQSKPATKKLTEKKRKANNSDEEDEFENTKKSVAAKKAGDEKKQKNVDGFSASSQLTSTSSSLKKATENKKPVLFDHDDSGDDFQPGPIFAKKFQNLKKQDTSTEIKKQKPIEAAVSEANEKPVVARKSEIKKQKEQVLALRSEQSIAKSSGFVRNADQINPKAELELVLQNAEKSGTVSIVIKGSVEVFEVIGKERVSKFVWSIDS